MCLIVARSLVAAILGGLKLNRVEAGGSSGFDHFEGQCYIYPRGTMIEVNPLTNISYMAASLANASAAEYSSIRKALAPSSVQVEVAGPPISIAMSTASTEEVDIWVHEASHGLPPDDFSLINEHALVLSLWGMATHMTEEGKHHSLLRHFPKVQLMGDDPRELQHWWEFIQREDQQSGRIAGEDTKAPAKDKNVSVWPVKGDAMNLPGIEKDTVTVCLGSPYRVNKPTAASYIELAGHIVSWYEYYVAYGATHIMFYMMPSLGRQLFPNLIDDLSGHGALPRCEDFAAAMKEDIAAMRNAMRGDGANNSSDGAALEVVGLRLLRRVFLHYMCKGKLTIRLWDFPNNELGFYVDQLFTLGNCAFSSWTSSEFMLEVDLDEYMYMGSWSSFPSVGNFLVQSKKAWTRPGWAHTARPCNLHYSVKSGLCGEGLDQVLPGKGQGNAWDSGGSPAVSVTNSSKPHTCDRLPKGLLATLGSMVLTPPLVFARLVDTGGNANGKWFSVSNQTAYASVHTMKASMDLEQLKKLLDVGESAVMPFGKAPRRDDRQEVTLHYRHSFTDCDSNSQKGVKEPVAADTRIALRAMAAWYLPQLAHAWTEILDGVLE